MSQPQRVHHGADLRAFRWPLQPLERKLDGALEAARLALALLQRQQRELDEVLRQWQVHEAQQQRLAAECVRRDPRLGSHAAAWLAGLQARRLDAEAGVVDLRRQLAAARLDCIGRQRQLACVQALRAEAQRLHAQEQLRRQAREADAAWLAQARQRRGAGGGGR